MTVTAKVFGLAQQSLANKEIDFDSDTVKVMLCASSYTPAQDTHRYKSDVTNEVTGTGYIAGGATLTAKVVSYDAASNTLKLTADAIVWATSTITARYAVFYISTGTDATSPLLAYWDFGADQSSAAGSFTLTPAAGGIVTLTAA